jgi:hypothetical protein
MWRDKGGESSLVLLKSNDNGINMRLSENVGSNEAFIILFYFDISFSSPTSCLFLFHVMDLNKSFHLFWEIFMNYVNLHSEGTDVKIHQKRENSVPFSRNSHEGKILRKSFLLLLCRRIRA